MDSFDRLKFPGSDRHGLNNIRSIIRTEARSPSWCWRVKQNLFDLPKPNLYIGFTSSCVWDNLSGHQELILKGQSV